MSEGKICEAAGKAAGTVARKTEEGLGKVKEGTSTICGRLGNLCGFELARLEKKREQIIAELGNEVWCLYHDKIYKSVFEQDTVKELVSKLNACEKEIKRIENELEAQRKKKEKKAALKEALSELKNKDPKVRKAAIRVIEKMNGNDAVKYLNKALKDKDSEVRKRAAEALKSVVNRTKSRKESATTKAKEELKGYEKGGGWYEIGGEKVQGRSGALKLLKKIKNEEK